MEPQYTSLKNMELEFIDESIISRDFDVNDSDELHSINCSEPPPSSPNPLSVKESNSNIVLDNTQNTGVPDVEETEEGTSSSNEIQSDPTHTQIDESDTNKHATDTFINTCDNAVPTDRGASENPILVEDSNLKPASISTPVKLEAPKPLKVPLFNKHGLPIHIMPGPEAPSNTLYIRNLPDRTGPNTLKMHLTRMFEQFGSILEVRCFRGLQKRGQAWVIFRRKEAAKAAMSELHGQTFFGKPMIVQFSRMPSDVIAKAEGIMEEFQIGRQKRRVEREKEVEERKESKKKIAAAISSTPTPNFSSRVSTISIPSHSLQNVPPLPMVRPPQPHVPLPPPIPFNLSLHSVSNVQPPIPPGPFASRAPPPPIRGMPHLPQAPPLPASVVTRAPSSSLPDEFAPPNATLFVSNLPNDATEEKLNQLFNSFPGFKEVRLVPGKAGIAFVEYRNEFESGVAKRSLHDTIYPASERRMRVTFRK